MEIDEGPDGLGGGHRRYLRNDHTSIGYQALPFVSKEFSLAGEGGSLMIFFETKGMVLGLSSDVAIEEL